MVNPKGILDCVGVRIVNILLIITVNEALTDAQWPFIMRMLKERRCRVIIRGIGAKNALGMWANHPRIMRIPSLSSTRDYDSGWSQALEYGDWTTLVEVSESPLPSHEGLEKMFKALDDADVALLQPATKHRGLTALTYGVARRILDVPMCNIATTTRAWRRDLVEEIADSLQDVSPREFYAMSIIRALIAGGIAVEIPDHVPDVALGPIESFRLIKAAWRLRPVRRQLNHVAKVNRIADLPDF